MKPISLRNVAAPSPAALSFLRSQVRYAFESPGFAQCRSVRGWGNKGLATCGRGHLGRGGSRGFELSVGRAGRFEIEPPVTPPAARLESKSYGGLPIASQTQRYPQRLSSSHLTSCTSARRAFSTTQHKPWRIWPTRQRTWPAPASPPTSPLASVMEDSGSSLSGHGVGRGPRSANELKMRCTELDENGNVTMISGEFKKTELIAKYGLLPRDLRKIDSSLLPHILVRPSAILINLLHLRVLIKHNRVLVFDAYGTTDSKSQSVFMYDLDLKLRQKESIANGTLAYEFRALEAVLISVTLGLEKEWEGVSEPVVRVLRELEEDIDRDKLRYLLVYSKKLGSFEQKARLVRDALTELLEADDDLSAMYLTEKAEGKMREDDDHTEVEMLLESYHKVADEIVQAAENLVSNIRNTEEIVKAILDANRNSLMLLGLKLSVLTLSITAGTFFAALYGMNLKNFIEESDIGFTGVSVFCAAFGMIVWAYWVVKIRNVQTLSMWGHHEKSKGVGLPRGSSWGGLGGWGSSSRSRIPAADCGEAPRLMKPGESFGELVARDRGLRLKKKGNEIVRF